MDCLSDQLSHILTDTDYYGILWIIMVYYESFSLGDPSQDIPTRFIAYGWNVLRVGDANDVEALTRAFLAFRLRHHHGRL